MGGRSASPRVRMSAEALAFSKRVRSGPFKRSLVALIGSEIREMGREPIQSIVDEKLVRSALSSWDPAALRPEIVAELTVFVMGESEARLRKQRKSIDQLIDRDVLDEVDRLISSDLASPAAAAEIVTQMLRQEFIGKLFAEIIHSAIISFNKRVNPLFGGIASAVLEDQIRGFIALGMPMLQEQAVSFVLSQGNQKVAADLVRGVARAIRAEPVANLVLRTSGEQRRNLEAALARILASEFVQKATSETLVGLFDALYPRLRKLRLDEVFDTELLVGAFAEPIAGLSVNALARPRAAALLSE